MIKEFNALLPVQMQCYFDVTSGSESFGSDFVLQFYVVVYLPVAYDSASIILRNHRLHTGFEIEDGKPYKTEAHRCSINREHIFGRIIRSPMLLDRTHSIESPVDFITGDTSGYYSTDSAHKLLSPPRNDCQTEYIPLSRSRE